MDDFESAEEFRVSGPGNDDINLVNACRGSIRGNRDTRAAGNREIYPATQIAAVLENLCGVYRGIVSAI